MKQLALLLIAAMALVGCGKKTTPAEPEASAEPTPAEKAAAEQVAADKAAAEKATAIKKVADEAQANAFVNTLGMKFVPVPGTEVAFCIWETRVKDYAVYAAANAGVNASWKKPFGDRFKQANTHPVVNVSWEDANAFCEWLTKKELAEGKIKAGQKYRLPTDAEWSVAVGLGKEKGNTPKEKSRGFKDAYPWGKEWPPPVGAGNYDKSLKVDKFEYTSPAGSFAANKLGLHDMGGNVYEWCEDWYDPAAKANRVLRGASWGYYIGLPDRLLSFYRVYYAPDGRKYFVGFRCVLVGGSGG
jgi:formylglycine-generating enzyme required for sulfatase activity